MNTVFITGTSSGIGKEAAKFFAKNGWNVIAAMRQPENERELSSLKNILLVQCDVTEPDSVKMAVELGLKTFKRIDVLVNNAGVYNTKPLESMTEIETDHIFNTNVKGVITCIKTVLPYFRQQSSGTIINVSSVAGFATFPFQTIYHASKWGIEGLSESLQYELKPFNIKVKIVEPGMIKTALYNHLNGIDDSIPKDYIAQFGMSYRFLSKNIQKGFPPIVSAKTIYQAANDHSWKMRYRSGSDTRLVLLLRALLPLNAFMRVVERMAGLRQTVS